MGEEEEREEAGGGGRGGEGRRMIMQEGAEDARGKGRGGRRVASTITRMTMTRAVKQTKEIIMRGPSVGVIVMGLLLSSTGHITHCTGSYWIPQKPCVSSTRSRPQHRE